MASERLAIDAGERNHRRGWKFSPLAASAIIGLLTGVVYSGAVGLDFVNYDDDEVILNNPHIRSINSQTLTWMFTQSRAGHYHPLTWLSFAVDYLLWGGAYPFGFHLTNVVLHALTAIGFYGVVRKILLVARSTHSGPGDRRVEVPMSLELAAAVVAVAFAIHPLRVESVAWVTERRDVLSGAFLMAAVNFYLQAAVGRSGRAYRVLLVLSLVAFCLSLLSKAWGITLPAVLLVLNVYPLRRIRGENPGCWSGEIKRVGLELLLFTLPAAGCALAAIAAQHSSGALQPLESYPLSMRLQQAVYGLAFYLGKMVWPASLVPFYGWPEDRSAMNGPVMISLVVLVLLGGTAWKLRRRTPALPAAGICYAILLSPVLGLTQSGPQLAADRYTYIPGMPWMVALAAGTLWLLDRADPARRRLVLGAWIVVLAGLGALTVRQTAHWRDGQSLWSYHLSVCPDCPIGHVNYGSALFEEAGREGDLYAPRRIALIENAMEHYRRASELRRGYLIAVRGVGRCLRAIERYDQALAWFQDALVLHEEDEETLFDIADTLAVLGRPAEALPYYRRIAERGGKHAYEAQYEHGRILHLIGRHAEAVEAFRTALRMRPHDVTCHQALAEALLVLGRDREAVVELEAGLALSPTDLRLQARLAFVLATTGEPTVRDADRALELGRSALAGWRATAPAASDLGVEFHEAYAAALAAAGRSEMAVEVLDGLLARAPAGKEPKWLSRLTAQRDRYRAGAGSEP